MREMVGNGIAACSVSRFWSSVGADCSPLLNPTLSVEGAPEVGIDTVTEGRIDTKRRSYEVKTRRCPELS